MKRFFNFETLTGLLVTLVVLSALTGLAGNALKSLGMDVENIGLADALTGLATLVVAALSWVAARRQASKVEVEAARARRAIKFLLYAGDGPCGGNFMVLPLHLRARDCSRAEVLGRIGMLPMKELGKRFSITALSEGAFLEKLNAVQDGLTDEVVIIGTEGELGQFDWEKMKS